MSGNQSGNNWDWKHSQESGYTYPVTAHLMERNRDGHTAAPWPVRGTTPPHPLAAFKTAIVGALLATAAVCAVGVLTSTPGAPPAAATPTTTADVITAPWTPGPAGPFTAPTKRLNPYTDNGTWLVGPDLPAGVYRVEVTSDIGGYWARCADPVCEVGAGLLANDVLSPGDSTVVVIAATDHSVRTAGVRLAPA